MSKLSGIRDVDREILSKLNDKELLKACSIDKNTWKNVCDDGFLKRRLLVKYPEIEKYKKINERESWKQFFLRAVHTIALMKEKFDYVYSFGNFVTQYNLLKNYKNNELLSNSAKIGELALVVCSLKNGADIHALNDEALRWASKNGKLEVVKYLIEQGADIHALNDYALIWASYNGHLEVVKYLVEQGADIHTLNDFALKHASKNGHLEVVKYLVKQGADIHAQNDAALKYASLYEHLEVVKYLKEH